MVDKRDPDLTRQKILEAAAESILRSGFRSASLDEILEGTSVTKGALYHHFPNKLALGYAVVEEVFGGWILNYWVRPLKQEGNAIDLMQDLLRQRAETITPEMITTGCPLNNLAQEMSPLDEGFRSRINDVFELWRNGFALLLERGQKRGEVRAEIDAGKTAAFLVASLEGTVGLAKNAQSVDVIRENLLTLTSYLESLRAGKREAAA